MACIACGSPGMSASIPRDLGRPLDAGVACLAEPPAEPPARPSVIGWLPGATMPATMRRLGLVLLAALPLLVGGCGSPNESGFTTSTAPGDNTAHPPSTSKMHTTSGQPPKKKSSSGSGGFTGQDAAHYNDAKQTCGTARLLLSQRRRAS